MPAMRTPGPARPPDHGAAGVYERPNRRPLWIAVLVAVVLLMLALCAVWWLR